MACNEVGNKYSGTIKYGEFMINIKVQLNTVNFMINIQVQLNTVNFMINCEVILVKKESVPRS